MKQTEYVKGTPADRADIVDFANYVFSQAHQPHDFKTLLPKAYGDEARDIESYHYLAKQDGRIRALIADRPLALHVLDDVLRCGCVGTVSVHPYSRGEGHMKRLMAWMIDDAKKMGYDLLFLGGQRQRYNYFGFEHAGMMLRYTVTATNLRHCLGALDAGFITFSELTADRPEEIDFARALANRQPVHGERPRDEFLSVMHNWNSRCLIVRAHGEMIGYVMGGISEMGLIDEALFPAVLKAYFAHTGAERVSMAVGPHEIERVKNLSALCENRSLCTAEMIHVLNWPHVIRALLTLKASFEPLRDGCVTLKIDDLPPVTIRVSGGKAAVSEESAQPVFALSHMEAQRLLFGLEHAVMSENRAFENWLPLPFSISPADTF